MDQSRKSRINKFTDITRWILRTIAPNTEVVFEVFNARHETYCRTKFSHNIEEATLRGITVSFRLVTNDKSILAKVTILDELSPPIGFLFRRV